MRNPDGTTFDRCITFDPGVLNDDGRIWLYYGWALSSPQLRNKNPLLKGITLSGGDPFYQPGPCLELAKAAHAKGLDVFAFTGYTFEEITKLAESDSDVDALLRECDFLIDGPFVLEQRSLDLLYRGSENQRILDTKRSLAEGKAVWAEEYR